MRRIMSALCVVLGFASTASAQVIPIRTVPLAQGDQFFIFPSSNLGMGGVSIALADTLLDPFRNPAMGARAGAMRLFSAPTVYSISQATGGGRTLPLALLGRGGSWFGGVSAAIQEVDNSGPIPIFTHAARSPVPIPGGGVNPDNNRSHGNTYAFASLGKIVSKTGLSVGGSVLWSRLHALDGVDLLYPERFGLEQSGHAVDLRLGLLKEWPGNRSLEALLLHDRFSMTHDVSYLDLFWDPGTQQFVQTARLEHNLDRTTTTGLHFAYQRPLTGAGWRIGWIGTANFVRQPRIAQNEIVTIPRDQGHSSAYNLGVGLSKTRGAGTFAVDAIYEPIWSTTWTVANTPVVTALGDTIPAGGRTLENRYHFSNVVLRLGLSQDMPLAGRSKTVGLELGLAVRSMRYHLIQSDRLALTAVPFHNRWVEWSPAWGLSLRFPEIELRYHGRVINGDGRPEVFGFFPGPLADAGPNSFPLSPGSTLNLTGVTTIMHQISVSLPLR